MSALLALSISIGVLGFVATFIFLKIKLLIWAAFVAWGCFFHTGGDNAALKNTIVGNIFGAVWAWIAALIILEVPLAGALTLPVWAGIVVGVTVFIICIGANIKAFSVIPANVYGYAVIFAYLLQTPDALTPGKLLSVNFDNALILVVVSMVIGALFGIASAKLGAALGPKAAAASA